MRHIRKLFRPRMLAFFAVLAGIGACIVSTTTARKPLPVRGAPVKVVTPVKAHLSDGGLVIFPTGATISDSGIVGTGNRYDATRAVITPHTTTIPLDSILAIETYERTTNPGRTLVYGAVSLAGSIVGVSILALAIFGSCPTIYADSAGVQVLQAESFSNSIAPLLARRDLDRLIARADTAGRVRLDVRNEAVETHYIDHLDLVEFRHRADEIALPSPRGVAIGVTDLLPDVFAHDAAGRNVGRVIAAHDNAEYSTDNGFLNRAIDGGPVEDYIEITVPRSAIGDTLALVLRARSSLLSTSVLYEYMLGRPGAHAINWLGEDLSRIATLAKLSSWYADNFGMRVSVRDGDKWKPVVRLLDFGPAAWRTLGVVVPVVGDDSVRIRLTFLADEFRIDHIGIARQARRLDPRVIPVTRVVDSDGRDRSDIAAMLRKSDGRNLETRPGERFSAEFDVGKTNEARTFMVGAEGYYTEWIRGSWLRAATDSVAFSPSRTDVRDMLRTWRAGRDSLQQQFFVRRVPVT